VSRRSVIVVTAVLAFALLVVPIGGALWYSWRLTVGWEQDALRGVGERATARAELSLDDATDTLRAANALDGMTPCSPEQVRRMQLLAFDSRLVEEVGYFTGGFLKCTSWGMTESEVKHLGVFDFVTSDGVGVTTVVRPLVTGGKSMIALELGSYNVLIDPDRFADILVEDGTSVIIASPTGQIVSALHDPDTAALALASKGSGAGVTGDYVYATSRSHGWTAVVTEPRSRFDDKLSAQRRVLLPAAFLAAIVPVGLLVWLSRRRLSLRGELATAVRKREFVVHYQPLIELSTSRCVGAEALVRWERADGVLLRPDLFISLAEETGLIEAITDQVIEAVGRDLGAFLASDRSAHVAINLSAGDVSSGRALDVVARVAEQHEIRPEQLWLEMTERGLVDVESARPHLERARRAGHRIAIDDFGTGYASLSQLQRLPLDILKIDKSFVDTIGTESATSSVTAHIIDMAKALRLQIVAEGVQTLQQADYLAAHGVDFAQGWLYSGACSAEEFIAFCRQPVPPVVVQRVAAAITVAAE
jgi:sensor c-di-GMP phosphodiesterase-like protein